MPKRNHTHQDWIVASAIVPLVRDALLGERQVPKSRLEAVFDAVTEGADKIAKYRETIERKREEE